MKILRHGTPPIPIPPFWIGAVLECRNCNAQFILEETDAVRPSGVRMGCETQYALKCPTEGCNQEIRFISASRRKGLVDDPKKSVIVTS